MKKLFVLFFILTTVSMLFAQLTAWPKNTLAELFTTTQCTNCPSAYAGMEIVHNNYDYSEFNSIRYYSSEGGGEYGSETVEPVFDYYGVTFTPQAFFNGTINVPGSGSEVEDGSAYMNAVTPHYFEASPFKMRIISFDPATGELSVGVTLLNTDTDLTDAIIRFALVENDLTELHTRVVRYITKSNLQNQSVGEEVTYNKTLVVSADYNQANLYAVSFIQLPDHTILQSVSTYPQPNPKVRVLVPFSPNTWDSNYDPEDEYYMFQGEYFSVINFGDETTINVNVEFDSAPDGWSISFCDHSNCYMGTAEVTLPPAGSDNAYHDFHVVIMPSSDGEATYHFNVSVPGTNINYQVPFYYSTSSSSNENSIAVTSFAKLFPAYPNPFNIATSKNNNIKIKYSILKSNTKTELTIYNIKGQKVKTLINQTKNPGNYDIAWDLKDNAGKTVSSGIYFYVLKANNTKSVKKLSVIK
jgi:hypothetical protein